MGVNAIQVNQSHKMMKDFPASIIKCDVIYLVMIIDEGWMNRKRAKKERGENYNRVNEIDMH